MTEFEVLRRVQHERLSVDTNLTLSLRSPPLSRIDEPLPPWRARGVIAKLSQLGRFQHNSLSWQAVNRKRRKVYALRFFTIMNL